MATVTIHEIGAMPLVTADPAVQSFGTQVLW
jgi:hypothetical protein